MYVNVNVYVCVWVEQWVVCLMGASDESVIKCFFFLHFSSIMLWCDVFECLVVLLFLSFCYEELTYSCSVVVIGVVLFLLLWWLRIVFGCDCCSLLCFFFFLFCYVINPQFHLIFISFQLCWFFQKRLSNFVSW